MAFDACAAPSQAAMDAWLDSPYRAVGIYVGGVARGCKQPNLTPTWIANQDAAGWRFLPLYVGLQAPCSSYKSKISTNVTTAAQQGREAALDGIASMQRLGLGPGSPLYLDMEAWNDSATGSCTNAVMAFTDAWTQTLNGGGYVSGWYSSASNSVTYLVARVKSDPTFHAPDALWFARWDGVAVTNDNSIPDSMWDNRQRVKQYIGGHNETHGGVTINIDSSIVDGPVAGASLTVSPDPPPIAVHGKPYSLQLAVSRGKGPYKFALDGGSLPAGLTMTSAGKISGTSRANGVTAVTIRVTDSAQPAHVSVERYQLVVTFSDIPVAQEFFNPISWLASHGFTSGYDDGTYRPIASVTRGAMAAFLYRWSNPGTSPAPCTASPFPDVAVDSPFCGHIAWLKAQRIGAGYSDGTFRATGPVTRGAMAAFLYRLTQHNAPPKCTTDTRFSDVPASHPFCGHIAWLATTGITVGYPDGTYKPDAPVTRGAMAAFLQRLDTKFGSAS